MAAPARLGEWSIEDEWELSPAPSRRHAPSGNQAHATPTRNPARAEARRRLGLIRRRRLDLLQDAVLALVLAIFVLSATAGLGVVALLAIPTTLALVGSLVIERRRRRPAAKRRA